MRVTDIHFSNPKKSDSRSYTSQLYCFKDDMRKKKIVRHSFDKVKVIGIKQHDDDIVLLLKGKNMISFMSELDNHIVENVKKNYRSWFVSDMHPDLIEEYFSSNVVYNKDYGDIIKLNCVSDFKDDIFINKIKKELINRTCDLQLVFKDIRFFKQKFVLECSIFSCLQCESIAVLKENDSHSIDEVVEDDNEIPEPDMDEIIRVRKILMSCLDDKLKSIEKQRRDVIDLINKMSHSVDLNKICHELEILV